jgi:uncharacterized protein DUF6265
MKIAIAFIIMLLYPFINNQNDHFQKLYSLAGGTWVTKTKKGFIGERWKKISGTELRSRGFEVTGNDTAMTEEVQLVKKNGQVYYTPVVKNENGGKPVPFKLTAVAGNRFTFSNPEHDYPQTIVYDFITDDSLHAWVDGKENGKPLRIDYNYKRVK